MNTKDTARHLRHVREYDLQNDPPLPLFELMKSLWSDREGFIIKQTPEGLRITARTGGITGNEMISAALDENRTFPRLYWKIPDKEGVYSYVVDHTPAGETGEDVEEWAA